jgi:predicted DsbA family dithiol-disulfide isomerase
MSHPNPVRIDVVSDVVCPWCFIGKRRLEKALALKPDVPVEVHWHPYFLNDWIPREGISRKEYLTTKFGSPERYKGIAQRVRRPRLRRALPTPWTRSAGSPIRSTRTGSSGGPTASVRQPR